MHRPGRRHQVLGAKYHPSTQRPAELLKAEQCRRSRQPGHDGRSMAPGRPDRLAPQRSHVPIRHRMHRRTSGGESGTESTRLGVSIINKHHWKSGRRSGGRTGWQGRADHHGQRRPDRALQEFTSVSQAKPSRACLPVPIRPPSDSARPLPPGCMVARNPAPRQYRQRCNILHGANLSRSTRV